MNPRVIVGFVGTITFLLGLAALFYPERVMGAVGLSPAAGAHPAAVLGEVRATYGGVFTVLGLLLLLAIANPPAHRGRILLVGLVWLGAAGGRLMGVVVEGNPGLLAWLFFAFEACVGTVLVAAALGTGEPAVAPAVAPPPV